MLEKKIKVKLQIDEEKAGEAESSSNENSPSKKKTSHFKTEIEKGEADLYDMKYTNYIEVNTSLTAEQSIQRFSETM